MSNLTKIWLIVAGSLVLVGILAFVLVMCVMGWDFASLSTVKYESNSHETVEEFNNISLSSDTAHIQFLPSDDEKCKVECYEDVKAKHSVKVNNGTLEINQVNEKKWYDYIGINISSQKITVYLPKAEYKSMTVKSSTGRVELSEDFNFENVDISVSTGDVRCYSSVSENLKIKTSTGYIVLGNISAGALDLRASTGSINASNVVCLGDFKIEVSTGRVNLSDVECKNLISSGDTGDITVKNVICSEKFNINRSTGDVKLEACDAAEIFVVTDTGDVEGTLLSQKVFIAKTDTGSIDVPNSIEGGRCEITTDTGDIKISVQ